MTPAEATAHCAAVLRKAEAAIEAGKHPGSVTTMLDLADRWLTVAMALVENPGMRSTDVTGDDGGSRVFQEGS